MSDNMPYLGFGLGLRPQHYHDILNGTPPIDFFEIITENFLCPGGKPHYYLHQVAERYPIVMHGVSLSIGSTQLPDKHYLAQAKQLKKQLKAKWISDHLSFSAMGEHHSHDLLPIPFTDEQLHCIVKNIKYVQDFLESPILIENVSSYLTFRSDEYTEWSFIAEMLEAADCYLLLDINNVFVNSVNHQFDPYTFIDALPSKRIKQIHLAGHTKAEGHLIDTHDHSIEQDVWALYEYAIKRFGAVSTMIERDDNIPALEVLLEELSYARKLYHHSSKGCAA